MEQDNSSQTRRSERVSVSIPVRLMVTVNGHATSFEGRLADLSAHGARVVTDAELPLNQIIELIPSHGPRYAVHGRVVWVRPPEAGIEIMDTGEGRHWAGQMSEAKVA